MRIRIDADDLPGLTCPPRGPADGGDPAYRNIHVAVQRRDRRTELLGPHPGDAPAATWTLECTTTQSPTGTDVRGPYVQGRQGERFIYLSWGTVDETGAFTLFRRAKLSVAVARASGQTWLGELFWATPLGRVLATETAGRPNTSQRTGSHRQRRRTTGAPDRAGNTEITLTAAEYVSR